MVEIIVAAAIFVTALVAFVTAFGFLDQLSNSSEDRAMAAVLLEEGAEAVLLLRDLGFDEKIAALEGAGQRSLYWNGSEYQTAAGESLIAGRYTRTVTVFPVYRDGQGGLADSGTADPDTRRVRIEVFAGGDALVSSEMLVHDSYE